MCQSNLSDNSFCRSVESGVELRLRIVTRSKKRGPSWDEGKKGLRWGVGAAPVDGQANEELIEAVGRFFRVPKTNINIKSGLQGRNKCLLLKGIVAEEILSALQLDDRSVSA